MTKEEVRRLKTGLYKIYWKSGGYSLASVGMLENGDKWIAPTNWVHPCEDQGYWRKIQRVEKIELNVSQDRIPVVVIDTNCPKDFEKQSQELYEKGYTLKECNCVFVNSEQYDYCSSYQGIFIDNLRG